MRTTREIDADEENLRPEPIAPGVAFLKRDPVEPEPVGTVVVKMFRITGYDQDSDGSLMARLDNIDHLGRDTGWSPSSLGLSPGTTWVLDDPEELNRLSGSSGTAPTGTA